MWTQAETMTTILAVAGLLLGIIAYELDIANSHQIFRIDREKYPDPLKHPRNMNKWTQPLRLAIAIMSLLAIMMVIIKQYFMVRWMNEFFPKQDAYTREGQPNLFVAYNENIAGNKRNQFLETYSVIDNVLIFEIFVLLLVPIPYFDIYVVETDKK